MSWADDALPADAGYTAVLAAFGTIGHSEWIETQVGRRTTGTPRDHAVTSSLTPASWIVA